MDKINGLLARKAAKKRSKAIDKALKAESLESLRTNNNNILKFLLLGSAGSGKTTVLKHLKIIYGKGFDDERRLYRKVVRLNVLTAMRLLTGGFEYYGYTLEPKNEPHLEIFKSRSINDLLNNDPVNAQATTKNQKLGEDDGALDFFNEYAESIKELWADNAIKKCYDHAAEIGLQDSAKFFLDNFDRISKEDYLPTDEDILHAKVKTTGVNEHNFDIGRYTSRIFDLGGQKSIRKFWVPYFEDINAIIFMAAISAYDQTLEEDDDINCMDYSIDLFKKTCDDRIYSTSIIILVFNKIDVLRHKLTITQVKEYFPDYAGDNSYNSVIKYFKDLFLDVNDRKMIFVHFTDATDTELMKVFIEMANDIAIRSKLLI